MMVWHHTKIGNINSIIFGWPLALLKNTCFSTRSDRFLGTWGSPGIFLWCRVEGPLRIYDCLSHFMLIRTTRHPILALWRTHNKLRVKASLFSDHSFCFLEISQIGVTQAIEKEKTKKVWRPKILEIYRRDVSTVSERERRRDRKKTNTQMQC